MKHDYSVWIKKLTLKLNIYLKLRTCTYLIIFLKLNTVCLLFISIKMNNIFRVFLWNRVLLGLLLLIQTVFNDQIKRL